MNRSTIIVRYCLTSFVHFLYNSLTVFTRNFPEYYFKMHLCYGKISNTLKMTQHSSPNTHTHTSTQAHRKSQHTKSALFCCRFRFVLLIEFFVFWFCVEMRCIKQYFTRKWVVCKLSTTKSQKSHQIKRTVTIINAITFSIMMPKAELPLPHNVIQPRSI